MSCVSLVFPVPSGEDDPQTIVHHKHSRVLSFYFTTALARMKVYSTVFLEFLQVSGNIGRGSGTNESNVALLGKHHPELLFCHTPGEYDVVLKIYVVEI